VSSRTLDALFDPASIAVVGASENVAKWGGAIARQALRGGDRRPVHLVNRRGGTILGRAAATSAVAIGEQVGLAVLCVPAATFDEAVEDALAAGARAIVAITAGFAEAGPDGLNRQRAAAGRVRAAGAMLVGPNCLGLVDNTSGVYLATDPFDRGAVAFLSQSGNLALELSLRLRGLGAGFSRFVSLGNQADVTVADLVTDCARHDETSAIAVYAEDFADGRAFASAAAAAAASGKPVVLLTPGGGEAAARGALSHTGAMTTSADIITAVCRDAGIHQVSTPRELATVLTALGTGRRGAGRRIGLLTDGGGHGALAADALERAGLSVPELSAPLRADLSAVLWEQSATANPVDLAGMGEQDPDCYADCTRLLLGAGELDAMMLTGYFGGYSAADDSLGGGGLGEGEQAAAVRLAAHYRACGRPLCVQSMYPDSPSARTLAAAGIPVFFDVEDAALALSAQCAQPAPVLLPVPVPAATPVKAAGYFAIRTLLTEAGIAFPPAIPALTEADTQEAAARIGDGPYVLKAVHLLHKSDEGGVALGLRTPASLAAAWSRMDAAFDGEGRYSVERMAELADGIELIAGVRRDPRFGPVLLVGLGGITTEVLKDLAFALAPVTPRAALELLRSLRAAGLFEGVRGRPPVNLTAAASAVARLAAFAAEHPEISEVEINPLIVTPAGAVALDARAVLAANPATYGEDS
jgi:acyl-CoA synthetase (NDP forming)